MIRSAFILSSVALYLGACAPAEEVGSAVKSPAGGSAGALFCSEPVVDFGDVWEGAVLEHEFLVELRSARPGPISAVRADCGCTIANLQVEDSARGTRREYVPGAELPPGARIIVNASYNTRGKEGPTLRTISLYGPSGVFALEVRANVTPWMTVEPERQDLGLLHERSEARTEFVVRSSVGKPFGLAYERKSVPDQVEVTLTPRTRASGAGDGSARASEWIVAIEVGPGMPRGPRVYPVEVRTDVTNEHSRPLPDGRRPVHEAVMWFSVNIVGAISLQPAHVIFGVVKGGEAVAKTVRLRSHDPEFTLEAPDVRLLPPLVVAGDEAGAPDDVGALSAPGAAGGTDGLAAEGFALGRTATVSTQRVPGENAWDIQVLLSGLEEDVPDNFRARLVIDTGHPEEGRIESLITGIRMPGRR